MFTMVQSKFDMLLFDIEGTTTSISFVKDVLFPYARDNVDSFLAQNSKNPEVGLVLDSLAQTSNELAESDCAVQKIDNVDDVHAIAQNVKYWILKDFKLKPLKDLQGLMWVHGYKSGAYKAHVYPDVPLFFEKCHDLHVPIYIYSSGSVFAQKLLFQHTDHGDLRPFIDGYFDTSVGAKVDAESYRRISQVLKVDPERILFITDAQKEAFAAKSAGLQVLVSIRPGTEQLSSECTCTFTSITTFDQVPLNA